MPDVMEQPPSPPKKDMLRANAYLNFKCRQREISGLDSQAPSQAESLSRLFRLPRFRSDLPSCITANSRELYETLTLLLSRHQLPRKRGLE